MASDDLVKDILRFKNDPTTILSVITEGLTNAQNGNYSLPDPSNTFAYLTEAMVSVASAIMVEDEELNRRLYPSVAQTEEDLYHHLSDRHMQSVFALPSRGTFRIIFDLDELKGENGAVSTLVNGVRKITIPRDTVFDIDGIPFSLQYPIDIRIMPHQGVSVVYDTTNTNPLKSLESNLLKTEIIRNGDFSYLSITADLLQYKTKVITVPASNSSGYVENISFSDDFYAARAFHYTDNGWEELTTTHSDLTYDITDPTMLFRVSDGILMAKIPPVYFTSGLVGNSVMVQVYTTKGVINTDIGRLGIDNLTVSWLDHLEETESKYKAPLNSLRSIGVLPQGRTLGGRGSLGFKELKSLTTNNAFDTNDLPITAHQLSNKMNGLGYTVNKVLDNISNRIYVASRSIPKGSDLLTTISSSTALTTSIGSTVGTLYTDMDTLSLLETSRSTGKRVTLLPNTLYSLDNGVLSIVPDSIRKSFDTASSDNIVNSLNDRDYLYSPFYYVFDYNYGDFTVKTYDVNPEVVSRLFLDENDNTPFSSKTESVSLNTTDESIELFLEISSSSIDNIGLDNIQLQLAYTPFLETTRAFLVGDYLGKNSSDNHIFKFVLGTDFDFDENNNLYLNSFKMLDSFSTRLIPTALETEFDFMIVVLGESSEDNNLNHYMADFLLPEVVDEAYVATREGIKIKLGSYLDNLWDKTRTVKIDNQFARYQFDVMAYYEEDVYEIDPDTGARVIVDYDYVVVHNQGDPVIVDGEHVILHKKNALILNEAGEPILLEDSKLERELALILLDAKYMFCTDKDAVSYRNMVAEELVRWINEDINTISSRLLEDTELLFYPKKTYGMIDIFDEDGSIRSVEAEQKLNISLTTPRRVVIDKDLKLSITKSVTSTVEKALAKRTVSLSDITTSISSVLSEDIYGIYIVGLGGDDGLTTMTMKDVDQTLSLAKELYILGDGGIGIRNDISISFIQHSE